MNTRYVKPALGSISVLLLWLVLPISSASQGARTRAEVILSPTQATPLECGNLLSGAISAAGEVDQFTFSGHTGQLIDLTLVQTTGFDGVHGVFAQFTLRSPAGVLQGPFNANTQRSFTLSETGMYLVRVNANNLFHTGSYNLGMECRQPLGPVDGTLNCGSLLSGKIESPGEVDLITFSGRTEQVIDLTLVQTTGFDGVHGVLARYTLFSPSGKELGTFDANTQRSFTLPETGTYLIRVNANNLFHTGTYNLGLECRQPLEAVNGTLICNGPVRSGTIEASGEVDLVIFSGQDGQEIDLTLVQTAGFDGVHGVLARLTLFSPTNKEIDTFDANAKKSFTLHETGTYLIRVNANNLFHTGSYNLGLLCLPLVPITLNPDPLTVTAGKGGDMIVDISTAQSAATAVTLSSSDANVAKVPASVTIPAGATSATFQVEGVAIGTATVSAKLPDTTLGGASATAKVVVKEPTTCQPNSALPNNLFSQVYYITGPNAAGDRLVVGKMPPAQLTGIPDPGPSNWRFCDPVQLAPGVVALAYVPTASERNGDFSPFAGLLRDPITNMPFPNGIIPANRLGDPHAWRILNQVGAPALVNAASYSATEVAPESIVAIFGTRLATEPRVAPSLPLPTMLVGTTVKVRDSAGAQRETPLFFVSPDQANVQIPSGTVNGIATATITSGNGSVSIGTAQIATVAPGLFAANATGRDVAAGVALRVKADGTQVYEPIARFDQAQGKFVPGPIDLTPAGDRVFLILFGTGFRFRSSLAAVGLKLGGADTNVSYAGPQNDFVGLDQVNAEIPKGINGPNGEVDVVLTVDGKAANTVRVSIKQPSQQQ